MAIPNELTADMLAKLRDGLSYEPPQTLLASSGITRELKLRLTEAAAPRHANPLFAGTDPTAYLGYSMTVVDIPKRKVYDWSGCRSPARAQRRHKLGHPQRVKITTEDVAYIVSDDVLRGYANRLDRMIQDALFGPKG